MENEHLNEKMALSAHLKDLKKSLTVMLAVFFAAFVACYYFAPQIVTFMININKDYTFVQSDVTELMGQYIKVSLIAALVVDSPIIVWQVHSFVSPGLTKAEDARFLAVMCGGLVFFVIGDIFCYLVVIPFTLQFFMGLNNNLAITASVTSLINLKNYISYLVALLVAFGCIFEMPVISAILGSIGLINPQGMRKARSIVVVVCFVVGAVITPPDVVSQCMVALPMLVLYEFSIFVCGVVYRRRQKKLASEGLTEEDVQKQKGPSRWQRAKEQVEQADALKNKGK